jgi:hypothetical protein
MGKQKRRHYQSNKKYNLLQIKNKKNLQNVVVFDNIIFEIIIV